MSKKKKKGPVLYKFDKSTEKYRGSLRAIEKRTKKTEDLLTRIDNVQKVILLILVLAFGSVAYNVVILQTSTYSEYTKSIESLKRDVQDVQYVALNDRIDYLERRIQDFQAVEIQKLQSLNQTTLNQSQSLNLTSLNQTT